MTLEHLFYSLRVTLMALSRRFVFTVLSAVIAFGTTYSILYGTYLDTSNPLVSNLPHPLSHSHYFANKSNPLNVYFIKKAWGWTSGLFLLLWITSPPQKRTVRRISKWAVATGVWVLFTMQLIGPSITDRVIVASGGTCMVKLPSGEFTTIPTEACFAGSAVGPISHPHFFSQISQFSSQVSDWNALPRLRRGHDVSGHIFLLTMSALFLSDQLRHSQHLASWSIMHRVAVSANVLLICIWILGSYTTSVYFHAPLEKLTGYCEFFLVRSSFTALKSCSHRPSGLRAYPIDLENMGSLKLKDHKLNKSIVYHEAL